MPWMTKILNPPRIILLGSIIIILVGGSLLNLPVSTHEPHSFIDSIFTSTSTVCVTGLIVKDTPYDFTRFGKAVILILVQLGGLAIRTKYGLQIVAIKRNVTRTDKNGKLGFSEDVIIAPGADDGLIEGDRLVVLGENRNIEKIRKLK